MTRHFLNVQFRHITIIIILIKKQVNRSNNIVQIYFLFHSNYPQQQLGRHLIVLSKKAS